jgi:hypothetical protein
MMISYRTAPESNHSALVNAAEIKDKEQAILF